MLGGAEMLEFHIQSRLTGFSKGGDGALPGQLTVAAHADQSPPDNGGLFFFNLALIVNDLFFF